jgi:hypothetical protein
MATVLRYPTCRLFCRYERSPLICSFFKSCELGRTTQYRNTQKYGHFQGGTNSVDLHTLQFRHYLTQNIYLYLWSRVILEKLIFSELVKTLSNINFTVTPRLKLAYYFIICLKYMTLIRCEMCLVNVFIFFWCWLRCLNICTIYIWAVLSTVWRYMLLRS